MNPRITQAALLLAAAGAIVIMLELLGNVASLIGLGGVLVGTVLAAPAGRGPRGGWWTVLAAGAALLVLGALLGLASGAVGGLIALLGGVAVLVGAAMGYPLD